MSWFRRGQHLNEEDVSAYADSQAGATELARLEAHLAGCEQCRSLLEDVRATKSMLSALPRTAPARSFALGREHARAPLRQAEAPRRLMVLAPAATLSFLVLLLAADFIVFPSDSSTTTSMAGRDLRLEKATADTFAADEAASPRAPEVAPAGVPSPGAGALVPFSAGPGTPQGTPAPPAASMPSLAPAPQPASPDQVTAPQQGAPSQAAAPPPAASAPAQAPAPQPPSASPATRGQGELTPLAPDLGAPPVREASPVTQPGAANQAPSPTSGAGQGGATASAATAQPATAPAADADEPAAQGSDRSWLRAVEVVVGLAFVASLAIVVGSRWKRKGVAD